MSESNGSNLMDVSWAPTPAPKNLQLAVLNRFMQHGGCAPVDGQLLISLDDASARTIRYYKMKAREAIGLVLHLLAPGQEDELMATVNPTASTIDNSLTDTVVKCYNNALSWDTKRQILSILATSRTKAQLLVSTCTCNSYLHVHIDCATPCIWLHSWTE